MGIPTSTKTITRLGVLTVLVRPETFFVAGERAEGAELAKLKDEIQVILDGKTHVPQWKVRDRSMERCIRGGRCIGYGIGNEPIFTTGMN